MAPVGFVKLKSRTLESCGVGVASHSLVSSHDCHFVVPCRPLNMLQVDRSKLEVKLEDLFLGLIKALVFAVYDTNCRIWTLARDSSVPLSHASTAGKLSDTSKPTCRCWIGLLFCQLGMSSQMRNSKQPVELPSLQQPISMS